MTPRDYVEAALTQFAASRGNVEADIAEDGASAVFNFGKTPAEESAARQRAMSRTEIRNALGLPPDHPADLLRDRPAAKENW